jgi:cobyrinic acid a,c-diamide synthase
MGAEPVVGHEFHRTAVEPGGGRGPAWSTGEGFVQDGVHASYLHLHWAGLPGVADRFVAAARAVEDAASGRAGALSCA